jgi:NADPH:quinone reductase
LAKAAGARVIAAASSDEKCELCRQQGADATINYSVHTPNRRSARRNQAATDGKGPDVIYDPVGGDFAEPVFRSIAWRGRYLVVGFRQRPHPQPASEPDPAQGRQHRRRVLGRLRPPRAQGQRQMMQTLAGMYAQGQIKPVIDQTLPMSELKKAYAIMGSRAVKGKLVMVN